MRNDNYDDGFQDGDIKSEKTVDSLAKRKSGNNPGALAAYISKKNKAGAAKQGLASAPRRRPA